MYRFTHTIFLPIFTGRQTDGYRGTAVLIELYVDPNPETMPKIEIQLDLYNRVGYFRSVKYEFIDGELVNGVQRTMDNSQLGQWIPISDSFAIENKSEVIIAIKQQLSNINDFKHQNRKVVP